MLNMNQLTPNTDPVPVFDPGLLPTHLTYPQKPDINLGTVKIDPRSIGALALAMYGENPEFEPPTDINCKDYLLSKDNPPTTKLLSLVALNDFKESPELTLPNYEKYSSLLTDKPASLYTEYIINLSPPPQQNTEPLEVTLLTETDFCDSNLAEEEELADKFGNLVDGLSIEEVIHLEPGRKVPKNLDDYQFVPITSAAGSKSTIVAGSSLKIRPDVICNYGSIGGKPYLDCSYALGMTYRGTLAAVAGVHITDKGKLRIVQLQGVNADASHPKKKYKTGLHGGFYWRDTMVQAWINMAENLSVGGVEIQGAEINSWLNPSRRPQLVKGYDKVAQRMGFIFNHGTGCWQQAA